MRRMQRWCYYNYIVVKLLVGEKISALIIVSHLVPHGKDPPTKILVWSLLCTDAFVY